MKWILEGGPVVPLQLLITAGVLVLIILQLVRVFGNREQEAVKIKNRNDLIIYAGVLNLVIGLIGQLMGIFKAMTEILTATDISRAVIAEGFRQASITTIYGFWSLIVISVFWIVIRIKTRSLE